MSDHGDKKASAPSQEAFAILAMTRSELAGQLHDWRSALQSEARQAGQAFRASLATNTESSLDGMRRLAQDIEQAMHDLQATQAGEHRRQRRHGWAWGAAVLLCLLSLAANYEMLYGYYHERIARLAAQANVMDAVNGADIVACGDGRLCARIDDRAPRLGDKKQYRLIERRPSR